MTAEWTITNPGGSGQSALASLGLSNPTVSFRVMAVSTARMVCHRDFDSEDAWFEYDELVTIYRDGQPFFTGRVQDIADTADDSSEVRTLDLADAWLDLEQIIYQEDWAAGLTTVMYPRAILGRNSAGTRISTGQQIRDAVTYAITQGASMTLGTVADGETLWPSEIRNQSCESVIIGEMRFHPDWIAWLDHSTSPVTFHARPKADLDSEAADIADEDVGAFTYAEVKRTVPRGVVITYESANTVDGEVYRATYQDTAGETTGRRIATAMVDLEGMNVSYQKSRIETRTLPTNGATMTAWMKLKYPELAVIPDAAFIFGNVSFALEPLGAQPPPVNPIAQRLAVAAAAELPRELVKGSIEDWMRKKAGRVVVKYDLDFTRPGATPPTEEQKKIIENFKGLGKTISVTATNAITKTYKGVTSYTAGEGRPEGIAAAMFAAATEQQYEGSVTISKEDVPAGRWHGKKLTLANGGEALFSGAVIHSATMDIEAGTMTLSFGPLGWLSAGDFLDLQRILNKRPVMWMSAAERTSNELGSELTAGSKGDIVSGFDTPDTITQPGATAVKPHYWPDLVIIPGEGEAADTYAVTVTHGWVREIKTGTGDALAYHEALNHFDETDPATDPITYTDDLTAHDIEVEQAVYITCQVDANGRIVAPESEEETPAVEIEVAADDEESIQYQPRVYDGTPNGTAGTLRFKLAKLEAGEGDDPPAFKMFMAGDHIHWSPPLPAFLSAWAAGEGVGIIFKDFYATDNAYRARAITQKDAVEASEGASAQEVQVRVRQEPNRIIVEGNSKQRKVKFRVGDGSLQPLVTFDDGLETEGVEGGNEEELNIPEVKERAADPQVRVSQVGFAGSVFLVEGNGVDQTLSYQIGTESPVEFARFVDGLFVEGGDIPIPAPESGGGTGLPAGARGDLLRHDGTAWVPFVNPGDPDSGWEWVIHHQGADNDPIYVQYKKITINRCESGTPVEYTILGIPTIP